MLNILSDMELLTNFWGLNDTNGGVRGSVWLFKAKVSKMVTFPSPIEYDFDLQTLNLSRSTNVMRKLSSFTRILEPTMNL